MDHPAREVAVVVPCYGLGRTVEEAVDSVLTQTRPAAEIVVVDDGSEDAATRQALARLQRSRCRVLTIEHAGVAVARNRGAGATQAPYIVFLDADDVLAGGYIEQTAARLDADEGLSFVSCAVQAFEGASYTWKPRDCTALTTLTHGSVHVSSMFRRTLWDAVGGFDASLPAYEDLDFWLRAIRLGFRGEILDQPLLLYRVRPDSRYRRGIEPGAYQAAMTAIIEKHLDFIRGLGTDVLLSKERFLVEVLDYQRGLRQRREACVQELAAIGSEIDRAREALAACRAEIAPPPAGGLILAYHRVASLAPDTHGLCIPAERFREHMRYLAERCTPMTLEELVRAARAGALPERAVAVTLDDGYLDALTTAAPILSRLGVPATFFVNSERLDEAHEAWHDVIEAVLMSGAELPPVLEIRLAGEDLRLAVATPGERSRALMALHGALLPMSAEERLEALERLAAWSGTALSPRQERRVMLGAEIRALSRIPGCAIGSHSAHHLLLPVQPPEVQRAELADSKRSLEALIEQPVLAFCYPFGEHSRATAEAVRQTPYLLAVTVDRGLVTGSADPMLLPRHEIGDCTVEELAATISRALEAGGESDQEAAAIRSA